MSPITTFASVDLKEIVISVLFRAEITPRTVLVGISVPVRRGFSRIQTLFRVYSALTVITREVEVALLDLRVEAYVCACDSPWWCVRKGKSACCLTATHAAVTEVHTDRWNARRNCLKRVGWQRLTMSILLGVHSKFI